MHHVHVFLSIFQYNIPDDSDIIDLADLSIVRDTGENSFFGGGVVSSKETDGDHFNPFRNDCFLLSL